MAEIQIQDLPTALTPLGANDVLPVVQSGITRSVSISSGAFALTDKPNVFTSTQTLNGADMLLNSNSDYSPQTQLTHAGATAGSGAYSILNRARGTYASPTIVASGDQLGNVLFQGYDGSAYRSAASIEAQVDGTPGASDMPGRLTFKTTPDGSTIATERMRITSAGYVGIGVTPIVTLDMVGETLIRGAAAAGSILRVTPDATGSNGVILDTSFITGGAGPLIFKMASTERMRITSAGDVGIGTSSPSFKLDVSGNSPSVATVARVYNGDASATAYAGLQTGTGSGLALQMYAYNGIGHVGTTSSNPLVFLSNNTERMRIDASGNALIGYTTSNGAYKLQVNSQIFATSATIATSDGSYKEDITPLDGALDLVSALNPVQFSWKEHPVHNFDRAQPTVGFIAQEVQQALADTPYLNSIVKANTCTIEPEELDDEGNVTKPAVTEEFLGIAEGNMIALLTKAIQELKAEFDAYKASHP